MMNFDIVFISYDEENAEENWNDLLSIYPHAKRVHGIKGIREAHQEASKLSSSDFFFTVDGDNKLIPNIDLNIPKKLNSDTVYVWRCLNVVNNLIYGYGAIKLWPRKSFQYSLNNYDDHAMTATVNYQVIDQLASETHFNSSTFSSWKSGFREAIKLSKNIDHNVDKYSKERLKIWQTVGKDQPFGEWCIKGAILGEKYYYQKDYKLYLNNFEKLKEIFLSLNE